MKLEGLTFDDVLIRPQKTSVNPEEVNIRSSLGRGSESLIPVIPAAMKNVFSERLAKTLGSFNICCPPPREESKQLFNSLTGHKPWDRFSLSCSPFDKEMLHEMSSCEAVENLFVDTVIAHHEKVLNNLAGLSREQLSKIIIGNICTQAAARDLKEFDLAAVKVGLGPGSICTTTQVTGVGIPQLQAIEEVSSALQGTKTKVIADGGIRSVGDIAKALGAGAHHVMMGRVFAATTEAGEGLLKVDGVEYKRYEGTKYPTLEFGSGWINSINDMAARKFNEEKLHRSEGVSGLVAHSGPAALLVEYIGRGLRASFAFVGASTLQEFQEKIEFQKVSQSSLRQAASHSLDLITEKDRLMVA